MNVLTALTILASKGHELCKYFSGNIICWYFTLVQHIFFSMMIVVFWNSFMTKTNSENQPQSDSSRPELFSKASSIHDGCDVFWCLEALLSRGLSEAAPAELRGQLVSSEHEPRPRNTAEFLGRAKWGSAAGLNCPAFSFFFFPQIFVWILGPGRSYTCLSHVVVLKPKWRNVEISMSGYCCAARGNQTRDVQKGKSLKHFIASHNLWPRSVSANLFFRQVSQN